MVTAVNQPTFVKIDEDVPIYEFKPGVMMCPFENGQWLLQQNPTTTSVFAEGKRRGLKIAWIVNGMPTPGNVNYTGELFVNGIRMSKAQAKLSIAYYLSTHVT